MEMMNYVPMWNDQYIFESFLVFYLLCVSEINLLLQNYWFSLWKISLQTLTAILKFWQFIWSCSLYIKRKSKKQYFYNENKSEITTRFSVRIFYFVSGYAWCVNTMVNTNRFRCRSQHNGINWARTKVSVSRRFTSYVNICTSVCAVQFVTIQRPPLLLLLLYVAYKSFLLANHEHAWRILFCAT